jgi:hypothetical protein
VFYSGGPGLAGEDERVGIVTGDEAKGLIQNGESMRDEGGSMKG